MKLSKTLSVAGLSLGLALAGTAAFADEPAQGGGWPGGADGARPARVHKQRPGADNDGGPAEGRGGERRMHRPGGPEMGPGGPEGPGGQRGPMEGAIFERLGNGRFAKEIGLTDEQVEAIKKDTETRKEASKATREQLQATRKQLVDLFMADADPQIGEVNDLNAKMAVLESELGRQRAEHMVFVRQTLTPEQETKVRDRIAEIRERGPMGGPEGPEGVEGPGRPMGDDDNGGPRPGGERRMRPRGPRPGGERPEGAPDDMGPDDRGPRPDGPDGDGPRVAGKHGQRRGPQGNHPGRGPEGADRGERLQGLRDRLANATPEEAAEIRTQATERLQNALERLDKQQAEIQQLLDSLKDTAAPAAAPAAEAPAAK